MLKRGDPVKKAKTSSFILTLDLKLETYQIHILEKRFNIARQMFNACLGKLLIRYDKMKKDPRYIENCKQPKGADRNRIFRVLNQEYGLEEYKIHAFVTRMYQHFDRHIDSNTAQKIATRAWSSFKDLLYKKAKKVHFKKFGTMDSVEGKTNKSGITFRGDILKWNGLNIPVVIDKNDDYAEKSLTRKIKFCRIQRKIIRGKIKYYVQLILEGIPPVKTEKKSGLPKKESPSSEVGLDIGISTLAMVSNEKVSMVVLCDDLADMSKEKRRIQRRMDRSRRATNPHKYLPDGTINPQDQTRWKCSKHYITAWYQLKEIERKLAACRKQSHERLANQVLVMGDVIKVEQMNYKALQKTRYGKRIGLKAPAMFLTILDRKLHYIVKELIKINTWKVKASQYDPLSDTYKKKKLSERWHILENGIGIQRDIFSAWLIKNVTENLTEVDRERCVNEFKDFYQEYQSIIEKVKKEVLIA